MLADSTVLLTGATGGLGEAIARALAAHGTRLLLTGRSEEVLDRLAHELGARASRCDLSSRAQVEGLAQEAIDAGVDVLIANAGLPANGALGELSQERIDTMLEVNLRAPIALARALVPSMMRARAAATWCSCHRCPGRPPPRPRRCMPRPNSGCAASRSALREDLQPHGVGVSVVLPGFIRDAGMFADSGATLPRGVGTRSPQDVAAAVVKAIMRNRAEVEVAPVGLRIGASFASLAPETAAAVSRRLGSHRVAADIAAGHRDKR